MAGRHKGNHNYTEDFKADVLLALEANGGNVSKTARENGIERALVQNWRAGKCNDGVRKKLAEKRPELIQRFEELIHLGLDAAPGKIDDAPLGQIMTMVGISVEKRELLRGNATERVEHTTNPDEFGSRLVDILKGEQAKRGTVVADPKMVN